MASTRSINRDCCASEESELTLPAVEPSSRCKLYLMSFRHKPVIRWITKPTPSPALSLSKVANVDF